MSPALLAVAGFDGYLRRFNPAFAVFGYSREELLSRPWIEFAHQDDRERMAKAMAALERGDDVANVENRVVCRDGSLRWVQWSTRVVSDEQLFYAAGRDVTESRRAAAEQAALRRVATLVARQTPAGGGVRRDRRGDRRAARGRLDPDDPLRWRPGGRGGRRLGTARAAAPDRDARAARRRERHLARVRDGPPRAHRRLRARERADRASAWRAGCASAVGVADRRGGPAVGRDDRGHHAGRAARHRTPSRASASSPS